MKKLVYAINLTVDGCCDHTKGAADEEIHAYFADMMRGADTLVYGRKTYELMVPFWPDIAKNNAGDTDSTTDFARAFDAVEKIVVFSRTLQKAEHAKTQLVHGGLEEEIGKLKQGEGKEILLGGVDLPSQLIPLGLIDEYRFVIQPLLVGKGRRLFDDIDIPEKLQLKLIDKKIFKSGALALHYTR